MPPSVSDSTCIVPPDSATRSLTLSSPKCFDAESSAKSIGLGKPWPSSAKRMRILAVDVGTGTQDILLFDSEAELENCVQRAVLLATAPVIRARELLLDPPGLQIGWLMNTYQKDMIFYL
mgnify:CR=1 FL=1